jgi:hypothetical protein
MILAAVVKSMSTQFIALLHSCASLAHRMTSLRTLRSAELAFEAAGLISLPLNRSSTTLTLS